MDAVIAAASAGANNPIYQRRPRSMTDDWKTLQCVSAPKILTMVGQVKQQRAPADTSGFVLIKFQVVSVAPDERPPQVEAAARTLHAMGTSTIHQPQPPPQQEIRSQLPDSTVYARPTLPSISDQTQTIPRLPRRSMNFDSIAPPSSPERADSSSAGSSPRDIHQCHFPGCSKVREHYIPMRTLSTCLQARYSREKFDLSPLCAIYSHVFLTVFCGTFYSNLLECCDLHLRVLVPMERCCLHLGLTDVRSKVQPQGALPSPHK